MARGLGASKENNDLGNNEKPRLLFERRIGPLASRPRHFTMPPRTNAKKAKKKAKAKAKANAEVQAEADDTKPSFDVDESVAAAVLTHVSSPRDRLALAGVSSVWKNAVTSEGAWGTCDLVLDSELGKRLTDERFGRLLYYCGDIKHLEVCDAPAAKFVGNFLFDEGIAAKFASLESFKLTNCPGVDCARVVDFMNAIGMTARPKDKRLRYLHLAGCNVAGLQVFSPQEPPLESLHACLAADQDDIFHLEQGKKSVPSVIRVQNKANFDLWWCECELIVPTSQVKICNSCTSAFCGSCAEEGSFCDGCGEFTCLECEEESDDRFLMDCDGCGERFCQECHLSQKFNICRGGPCSDKEGTDKRCFKAYCEPCQKKKNVVFGICFECFGVWCMDCAYDKDGPFLNTCFGQGGCYDSICGPCAEKTHQFYAFCSGCNDMWCTDCAYGKDGPRLNTCFGQGGCYKSMCRPCEEKTQFYAFCFGCNESWCPDCDPGVDFYPDPGSSGTLLCPTCAGA